jgi:hypothetical protein
VQDQNLTPGLNRRNQMVFREIQKIESEQWKEEVCQDGSTFFEFSYMMGARTHRHSERETVTTEMILRHTSWKRTG